MNESYDQIFDQAEACFMSISPRLLFTLLLRFQMVQFRGKFNNASALGRSFYWCQALHIMNKDRYQSTSARIIELASGVGNGKIMVAISSEMHFRSECATNSSSVQMTSVQRRCSNMKWAWPF